MLGAELAGGRLWDPGALAARATIAAIRGDAATVERLTAEIERLALPSGARMVLGLGQLARGILSLGAGRHAEAYGHLRRIDDPDDPAWHPRVRLDTLADHVEAAVSCGHGDAAAELMARLGPIARSSPSPWLRAGLALADAHVAAEGEGDAAFTEARRQSLVPFPLYRARLDLAHGQWLRRNRRRARGAGPAAHRARHVRGARRPRLGPTRAPRAPGLRRGQRPAPARLARRADAAGAADRADGRPRAVEPRHRRTVVPLPAHGRVSICTACSRNSASRRARNCPACSETGSAPRPEPAAVRVVAGKVQCFYG